MEITRVSVRCSHPFPWENFFAMPLALLKKLWYFDIICFEGADPMNQELMYIFRILVASLCGALIGLEREKRGKRAGLRTHIILAASSALMMLVSKYGFTDVANASRVDASRVAASVIASIGFLGIGVIHYSDKGTVGLTTSAGLLATVAIGLTIGAGMYLVGIFTAIFIAVLQALPHKEGQEAL